MAAIDRLDEAMDECGHGMLRFTCGACKHGDDAAITAWRALARLHVDDMDRRGTLARALTTACDLLDQRGRADVG